MKSWWKSAFSIIILFFLIAVLWGVIGNIFFSDLEKPEQFSKLKKVTTNLIVEDVNETIKFYNSILGLEAVQTYPDSGKYDFALLSQGDIEVMIQSKKSIDKELDIFKGNNIAGTISLYFDVINIDSLYNKISDKVEVIKEINNTFYGTREFAITDNSGYLIIFAEDL